MHTAQSRGLSTCYKLSILTENTFTRRENHFDIIHFIAQINTKLFQNNFFAICRLLLKKKNSKKFDQMSLLALVRSLLTR